MRPILDHRTLPQGVMLVLNTTDEALGLGLISLEYPRESQRILDIFGAINALIAVCDDPQQRDYLSISLAMGRLKKALGT